MATIIKQHEEPHGQLEGETCRREGCTGIIAEHEVENCSCHIAPPCPACTAPRGYCPECGWEAVDDEVNFNDFLVRPANPVGAWSSNRTRPLDPTKIDWRSSSHTHASMVKEGIFPFGTTRAEVEDRVRGTFGGRFDVFTDATPERPGTFKYIAYTD